jgi:hypothetical protein
MNWYLSPIYLLARPTRKSLTQASTSSKTWCSRNEYSFNVNYLNVFRNKIQFWNYFLVPCRFIHGHHGTSSRTLDLALLWDKESTTVPRVATNYSWSCEGLRGVYPRRWVPSIPYERSPLTMARCRGGRGGLASIGWDVCIFWPYLLGPQAA